MSVKMVGEPEDEVAESKMPLLEHLRELRDRLIRSLYALIGGVLVCFLFSQDIFNFLSLPINAALAEHGRGTLAITEAMEAVIVQMKVAGFGGLTLAMPVISWQAWRFIAPGLYDHEKRKILPLVFFSTLLFVAGAAFCYYVIFPFGLPLMLESAGPEVQAVLSIQSYLNFSLTALLAFGISFQLPILVYFLARVGLIDHLDMIRGVRYSIVGIFVIAAILTPPDWISQMLMAAPLLLLYGVGIVVAWLFSTKKRDKLSDKEAT